MVYVYLKKKARRSVEKENKIWRAESEFSSLAVRFIELEQQAAIRHNSIILFFCLPNPPSCPLFSIPLSQCCVATRRVGSHVRIVHTYFHRTHSPHPRSHPPFTLITSLPPLSLSHPLYFPPFCPPRNCESRIPNTPDNTPTLYSTSKSTPRLL